MPLNQKFFGIHASRIDIHRVSRKRSLLDTDAIVDSA